MKSLSIIIVCLLSTSVFAQQNFKRAMKLMGCGFEITVVANDEEEANAYIDLAVSEITRIENMISSWDPASQTSEINNNAGKQPVTVDPELVQLIERAKKISALTEGAFDISYASMDRIWKFDGSMTEMPSETAIKNSVARVGYEKIILNKETNTVFLKDEGMKIGFGAIGKGYAADKAKALLIEKGVSGGIINASGDLNTWGIQADGSDWYVAIKNPLNDEKVFSWMPVKNSSVVTSGNYKKYVQFNGVRYSHIINPKTGYPSSGVRSVSIFTKNAELADALSTSVFVMGLDTGLHFINQLKGVECVIIDDNYKIHTSNNIQLDNLSSDQSASED
ncbi:FAD:protein FMN transferase [Aureisphaera galaxeae]|uniref:FAD:protein FMN transferase n=1 Tax=Aureisphaera galaxeae TaxID=1538023 RepID=UPI002350C9E6|nr:FAD:protein FMN transferase [Aureisphaera galaxeae]MDC8004572.1 FAD:protein FMN transferase [Aureisphaera galaxeae]